mmetsp:Transcript_6338/g.13046  ORF Transcript_6338/g.13046 Transcript_6338/m.13046 type:complete len:138 (+) Transcript_6338:95-508(+)
MSAESPDDKVVYSVTVVTDHKGNTTKTTTGRNVGGSGQRFYTKTKTKTTTNADGQTRTEDITITYERAGWEAQDTEKDAYKQTYMGNPQKPSTEWEKPAWTQQNPGSSLRDGRNLEQPITTATQKNKGVFSAFTFEK